MKIKFEVRVIAGYIIGIALLFSIFIVIDKHKSPAVGHSSSYVCPELRDAVDQFYAEAISRGFDVPSKGLTVVLGEFEDEDSTSSIAGFSYGHRTIWISRPLVVDYLTYDSPSDKLNLEYVVFHELGHSLLGLGHSGGMSIMNAYCESAYLYAMDHRLRKHMIDELFLFYHN